MKLSTVLPTVKTKQLLTAGAVLMTALAVASLFVGKYPLSLRSLLSGDEMQLRVFWTLRASRTVVGVIGGFGLGAAGFVYQTVFRNPLASPDIIGVSSGASAGAAFGIVAFGTAVTFARRKRENEQCRKQERHEFLHLNYFFCFLRNTAKHAGISQKAVKFISTTLYI